jgi:hypothetical protein
MTKVKSFAFVLLAAAALASPALARGSHVTYRANDARAKVSSTLADRSTCIPAPRVGAFATAPWTDETPCEPNTGF